MDKFKEMKEIYNENYKKLRNKTEKKIKKEKSSMPIEWRLTSYQNLHITQSNLQSMQS